MQCFLLGGTQNDLNLAAKRGSDKMTASDWSILVENAIRSEDESAPQGNFGQKKRFGGFVLPCTHNLLTNLLSELVRNPEWLPEGLTYLLPKTKERDKPENYSPITCLSATYKLLTPILTERTSFIESNDLFAIEQKGVQERVVWM